MSKAENKKKAQEEDEEDHGSDFKTLSKSQPPVGSHFILKSEQKKFQVNPDLQSNIKLFQIDTKILNLAMKSIPYNERYSVNVTWSEQELQKMKTEAELWAKQYEEALRQIDIMKKLATDTKSTPQVPQETANSTEVRAGDVKGEMQDWLDDILSI